MAGGEMEKAIPNVETQYFASPRGICQARYQRSKYCVATLPLPEK
jgi:hypothetical protein